MANCVKCGADLQHGALKCEYCGSAVDILKAAEPAGAVAAGNFGAPGAVAPKFKIVSIGMMILLVVVTFGLYVSGWFFARRRKFRELSPKGKNTPAAFGALLTVHIIYLFVLLGHFGGENPADRERGFHDVVVPVGNAHLRLHCGSVMPCRASAGLRRFDDMDGASYLFLPPIANQRDDRRARPERRGLRESSWLSYR